MSRWDAVRQTSWTVRPWAWVVYFALFAVMANIGVGAYHPDAPLLDVEALVPGLYSHASNLVLSCLVLMLYGLVRLVYDAGVREVVVVGLVIVAANYGYELFLPLANTRDVVDAHYGALGAGLALLYLALVRRHGLKPAG
ncbi:hypothetical protein [Ornithinimicrobium flavum]|uniref:hypothetical protein n=1 Tax=Ornithinimicrobium flavum TaxID=1288636 RepID=UPI00106FF83D|nr:hypothetical protein [Ornithinimicrobium flavum]